MHNLEVRHASRPAKAASIILEHAPKTPQGGLRIFKRVVSDERNPVMSCALCKLHPAERTPPRVPTPRNRRKLLHHVKLPCTTHHDTRRAQEREIKPKVVTNKQVGLGKDIRNLGFSGAQR